MNQWFIHGDMAFIIVASAMVLLMVPGLGFLYSGLARRKSALSLIWACIGSSAVVTFQWYFWGYSLAFSASGTSGYIGNLKHFALQNVLAHPTAGTPLIPELLYSFYQLQFAAVTVAIVMGAIAERGRLLPAMVFSFLWMTLVYCPIACWVWNVNGWAFKFGVLDYAGMSPARPELSLHHGFLAHHPPLQAAGPSKSAPESPPSHTRWSSESARKRCCSTSGPTTSRSSLSAPSCSGSAGWASTAARPSAPTCAPSWPAGTPT